MAGDGLMRVALGVEYDGTAYNGWQRQRIGTGVQQLLEDALSQVANEPVAVVCAGRTDTGVHASGQVVHFDTGALRSPRSWLLGANTFLPADINVNWAQPVDDDFHARFSATERHYRYRILNRLARSSLYRDRAWCLHPPLDASRMQCAAQLLLGEHDFSAFRAAGCQAATPVRVVSSASVTRSNEWLLFEISANAFLQHMVRNLAGSLVAIGEGVQEPEWIERLIESRDRTVAGIAAPAQGLTLVGVTYPERYAFPAQDYSAA